MANFKKPVQQNGIFCLEVPWSESREYIDETTPKSVLPGIQLIARYHGMAQLNYKTCATTAELRYHLQDFSNVRKSAKNWYGCFYLASHGSKGSIYLPGDEEDLTLSQLAKLMGKTFKGCIIYFGSCSVLSCANEILEEFKEETEVDAIFGYERDVDWVDSTVLDILFLNKFLDESRPRSKKVFADRFYKEYSALIDRYSMVYYD